jgi:hypothetical protein
MAEKPNLRVALFAGDTEVASSTDSKIWLAAMAAITGEQIAPSSNELSVGAGGVVAPAHKTKAGGALPALADEISVSAEELVAACSPSDTQPFIELDHRNWESLKANTAPRGSGAISGTVLAATLLLLWSRHSSIGKVSVSVCNAVLDTIGLSERNQARTLRNCEWIQVRDEGLRLNPARVSTALKIARAYILRTPIE